jgi:hypothetical protein
MQNGLESIKKRKNAKTQMNSRDPIIIKNILDEMNINKPREIQIDAAHK